MIVPPGHRDGVFVRFVVKVIGVVALEGLVMHDGVGLEWVAQPAKGPVHDEAVQRPFVK